MSSQGRILFVAILLLLVGCAPAATPATTPSPAQMDPTGDPIHPSPTPPGHVETLDTILETAQSPLIAFTCGPKEGRQIYLVALQDSVARPITGDGADNRYPSWSSSGDRLAFFAGRDLTILAPGEPALQIDLGDMDPVLRNPAWSPDDTQLAFTADLGLGPGGWRQTDVILTDADGSSVRNLTAAPSFEAFPAWSPGGDQIAYVSGQGPLSLRNQLYARELAGGEGTRMSFFTGRQRAYSIWGLPAWSPDGGQLLFSATTDHGEVGATRMTFAVDLIDGGLSAYLVGLEARWSPDGDRVAISCYGLCTAAADGSGVQLIAGGYNPAWSPDGSMIAYYAVNLEDPSDTELRVIGADGSNDRLLHTCSQGVDPGYPAWRPAAGR